MPKGYHIDYWWGYLKGICAGVFGYAAINGDHYAASAAGLLFVALFIAHYLRRDAHSYVKHGGDAGKH